MLARISLDQAIDANQNPCSSHPILQRVEEKSKSSGFIFQLHEACPYFFADSASASDQGTATLRSDSSR